MEADHDCVFHLLSQQRLLKTQRIKVKDLTSFVV